MLYALKITLITFIHHTYTTKTFSVYINAGGKLVIGGKHSFLPREQKPLLLNKNIPSAVKIFQKSHRCIPVFSELYLERVFVVCKSIP